MPPVPAAALPGVWALYQFKGTEYFGTTTASPGQGIPLMQVAAMGPGAIVSFSLMYAMLIGREWELGDAWSFTGEYRP